jgi:AAA family ATP:ADP antiporter
MVRLLERLLQLGRGDLRRGALLFTYLFLVIGSYVVGKAARDALFLDRFAAIQLPYADIAIAVLVGFAVAAYVRVGRRTGLRDLQIVTLLFLAANAVGFWWLARFSGWPWTFPIFYIWVGIYGVLAPVQVWTLANYALTTREAKRLFGLVGSGAIAGWICGGAVTRLFADRHGTESLLLAMAVALVACAGVVAAIWRERGRQAEGGAARPEEEAAAGVRRGIAAIAGSAYLRAIAAVICLSSFVTTLAGWQFKAFAKRFLETKDALAAFFGDFNFFAGILCLLVQLFLTSRLLKRFGIGPALFVVPVALLLGSTGVLVWFSLAAAVLLKGSDQILRYSIDKSTVELLYLPVPGDIKVQVKSFIDTVIWRLGDGLAGVALLLAAAPLGLAARPDRVSWMNLALIGCWLAAAAVARRRYVTTLRDSIQKHRLDAERAAVPVLDRSTSELLGEKLRADDPDEILYALDLFLVGAHQAPHPAVRGLLRHPSAPVRRRAVAILSAAGDRSAAEEVESLLRDEDLGVRTEALLFLAHRARVDPLTRIRELGDFPGFSIRSGMVSFLAQPGPSQNLDAARLILEAMAREPGEEGREARREAARLLASLPGEFDDALGPLLRDEDPEVAGEAIRAVAARGERRFVPLLLERLEDPRLGEAAAEGLARFGERVVGVCRDHLADPETPLEVRRRIPGVLARIGDPLAGRILSAHLLSPDTELRYRTLAALNKLRRANADLEVDEPMVETVLGAEILGHYRSYQILGTLRADLEKDAAVVRTLGEAMNREVERIFRLLALLHPRIDLHSAYFGLQSSDPVVHDNSLEFLDNVLRPQIRGLLVPLLDSQVSLEERVRRADRVIGIRMESREGAVAQLIASPDPWLKSCGAFAIGSLGLRSLEGRLDICLDHPDPLLRETARQAKARLAAPAGPGRDG